MSDPIPSVLTASPRMPDGPLPRFDTPLVPRNSISGRALVAVVAIMTFLAALTTGAAQLLASASQATESGAVTVIIGFNVRPETRAEEVAKQESVDIRLHSIIYKVEEEIKAAMIGMLEKIEKEKILGKADVREVFRVPRIGAIAGCFVRTGVITRGTKVRFLREGTIIWKGAIASLRRFKEDARDVREGFECGIGLENFQDLKPGDIIETFELKEIARTSS